MSDKDDHDRLEQRYRRLGTRDPACVCCGERYPFCLELHHLAGRKHHEDLSIVCRNCHRKLSDRQRGYPAAWLEAPSGDRTILGFYLLGLCDLLSLIIDTLRRFGKRLLQESTSEDQV